MIKKSVSSVYIVVLVIIILVLCFFLFKKNSISPVPQVAHTSQQVAIPIPITITEQNITETNFTGTKPVIVGTGALADAARTYINQTVALFKETADQDVPSIDAAFGSTAADSYEIDLKATYIKNPTTESIVINDYEYTGGANGNNLYKVFTASTKTGELLSLSDIIATAKQAAFTTTVKNKLSRWIPDGSTSPVVFQDAVSALTFSSFTNWSLDANTVTIYFDKYDIGPGSLGAIAFPIARADIAGDIVPGY